MTKPHDNAGSLDPLFQPFVEHWITCVQQANATTNASLGGVEGSRDPRAWRRQWFEALSSNTDNYLRSPAFLQFMKSQIDALIRATGGGQHSQEAGGNDAPVQADYSDAIANRLNDLENAMRVAVERCDQLGGIAGDGSLRAHTVNVWQRFLTALQIQQDPCDDDLGRTPYEVVYEEGSLRLLRYCSDSVRFAEPILICFALVNRPYILDLQDDRSVVRQLLNHGFEVFLIDWGIPTLADQALQLSDYVCRLMNHGVTAACERSGSRNLNLLGYCMGGTLSTMFAALYPERVRSLILMATPIDFGGQEGLLNLWARREYFDVDELIDAYGNCPGEFLRYCFLLMKPVQNTAEKYLAFCERVEDDAFLENFFALERWANDSIPVAGETFRQYVKQLYQQNLLIHGEMSLDGVTVDLRTIACPLLLLVAKHDHLVPPSSTLALQRYVSSADVQSLSIDAGHIGLAVSSKAQRELWPRAAGWIADHSTPATHATESH